MYGGQMDERTLEKTQQQHLLYQQEQHQQILQQQIQVGLRSWRASARRGFALGGFACELWRRSHRAEWS